MDSEPTLIELLAHIAVAGTAMATMFDFSELASTTNDLSICVDITSALKPAGYAARGVTFRYEDFGRQVDYGMLNSFGGLQQYFLEAPSLHWLFFMAGS